MTFNEYLSTVYKLRDETNYNASVAMDLNGLQTMTNNFDQIFTDHFKNFTSEIASLKLYPFKIKYGYTGYLSSAGRENVDVSAYLPTTNSNQIYLGQIVVNPYFNNFMDYKGYTYLKLYLPGFGFTDLDVNDCMGKFLQLRLIVDFVTGKGLFVIGVSDNSILVSNAFTENDNFRIISILESQIGVDIPLGSSNYSDIVRNTILGAAKTVVATGLAVSGNIAASGAVVSTSTSNYSTTIKSRGTEKGSRLKTTLTSDTTINTEESTVRPVNKMKPVAEVFDGAIEALNRTFPSGSSDRVNDAGLTFLLGTNAILYIYRPKVVQITDTVFSELYGKPLGTTYKLSELSGHTAIGAIEIQGDDFNQCTMKELEMLENALADDIIL